MASNKERNQNNLLSSDDEPEPYSYLFIKKEEEFKVSIEQSDFVDFTDFEEEVKFYLPKYFNILSLDMDVISSSDSLSENYSSSDDKKDFLINEFKPLAEKRKIIYFPFYKMDHSYVTYSIHEFGGIYGYFDSGQIGFVYITEANAKKLLKATSIGPKEVEKLEKLIDKSLVLINDFTNGGYSNISISYKGDYFYSWEGLLVELNYPDKRKEFIKDVYKAFIVTFGKDDHVTIENIGNVINRNI